MNKTNKTITRSSLTLIGVFNNLSCSIPFYITYISSSFNQFCTPNPVTNQPVWNSDILSLSIIYLSVTVLTRLHHSLQLSLSIFAVCLLTQTPTHRHLHHFPAPISLFRPPTPPNSCKHTSERPTIIISSIAPSYLQLLPFPCSKCYKLYMITALNRFPPFHFFSNEIKECTVFHIQAFFCLLADRKCIKSWLSGAHNDYDYIQNFLGEVCPWRLCLKKCKIIVGVSGFVKGKEMRDRERRVGKSKFKMDFCVFHSCTSKIQGAKIIYDSYLDFPFLLDISNLSLQTAIITRSI